MMAIGYRAILRLEKDKDAIDVAERQLRSWLSQKRRDRRSAVEVEDWDGPGVHPLGDLVEIHVVYDDYDEERGRRHLYRLIETNSAGKFIVSVYAASLPRLSENNQTIVVEVEKPGVDLDTALYTIDPPRVVRSLLDDVEIRDGLTRITGKPITVRAGDVSQVIEAITDPERMASVIVAGSFARELDEGWAQAVASLTRQSTGVAATFVVCADALQEVENALGDAHHVGAGRVRTYLPKVDLSDPRDALRHKWLGPATLTRSLTGKVVSTPLQRRHAEVVRRRFVESELPSDVRRTFGILRRAETTAERSVKVAARIASRAQPEAADDRPPARIPELQTGTGEASEPWYQRAVRSIRRWLNVQEATPNHFDELDVFIASKVADSEIAVEQLEDAAIREDQLDEQIATLQRRIEDMELDLAQNEQDEVENHRELTELRRRLSQSADPDTYVGVDPVEWDAPDSVEELVGRITAGEDSHAALEFVEFTGDVDKALEIDRRYPSGLYAKTLWLYVRTLHDYAKAKSAEDFSGSLHMYLNDDRAVGTKCPSARHASRESESVLQNSDWSAERVFPVPSDVEPSGSVLMDAHFKPAHKDTFAPRMHYCDDTAHTGKIYIGYIGKHLTNKQT